MKEAFEKLKKWFGELQKKAEDDEETILHYEGHSLSYEFLDGRKDAFKEAQKIVSEVEAEYEQQDHTDYANIELYAFWKEHQWIPCSERLPEKSGRVLVSYESINDEIAVSETSYDYKRKTFWISPCVIAWMPLPSPFKPTTD